MLPRRLWVAVWSVGMSIALSAPVACGAAGVRVWTESSLRKVFRDDAAPLGPARSLSLTMARGEHECGQVVVRSRSAIGELSASLGDLRSESGNVIPGEHVELFWVRYVEVRVPSQNRVTKPGWWPDPLLPVRAVPTVDVPTDENQPVWLAVHAPGDTPPGLYRGTVSLRSADADLAQIPLSVEVLPLALPKTPTMRATAALVYPAVRDWLNAHGRDEESQYAKDSDEWQAVARRYYEFLLDYRICAYELPVPLDSPEAETYLTDPRVHSFRLPWQLEEPEAFQSLVDRLDGLGVLEKAFYYQADEPVPQQHQAIRAIGEALHGFDTRLPQLVTHRPTESLFGAVDIWCPNLGDANAIGHLDLEELAHRRQHGEQTWWYTCCVPTHPYPTWLVDDDAVCPRAFCWMMAQHGIQGFVYAMVNGWGDDPYAHVTSFGTTNGDGLLLYPGEVFGSQDPFPSIRLMILRDGIEDYELLRVLDAEQARVARRLRATVQPSEASSSLCGSFIRSLTDFERNPSALLHSRKLLLDQLVASRSKTDAVATVRVVAEGGDTRRVRITGAAERLAWVNVNDARVAKSQNGSFAHELDLPASRTEVIVSARARTQEKRLVLPLPPRPAPAVDNTLLSVPQAPSGPRLDAKLDEEAWQRSLDLRVAHRKNGVTEASLKTTVKLMWHGEWLYFALEAELFPRRKYTDGDNLKRNWVGLRLDPGVTHDRYHFIVLTAKGNVHREVRTRAGRIVTDVPTVQSEVNVNADRFVVEGRLALNDVIDGPLPGQRLGLNLLRRSRDELDALRVPPDDVTRFAVSRLE